MDAFSINHLTRESWQPLRKNEKTMVVFFESEAVGAKPLANKEH